jgi:hypothetical protein
MIDDACNLVDNRSFGAIHEYMTALGIHAELCAEIVEADEVAAR